MSAITYTAKRGLSLLGDEVGAWMADTTEETLAGSDLVVDGDMLSMDGWTEDSVTTSISAGVVTVTNSGAANKSIYQDVTTVIGKSYIMTAMATNGTGVARIYFSGAGYTAPYGTPTVETWIATSATTRISCLVAGADGTDADFDYVTLRLADPDLSTNGDGLGVHGSIIKSAVNTGADLVGYSGFSASNYLEQPYNSFLNFGTGDFCFMGWAKSVTEAQSTQTILQLGSASDAVEIYIGRESSSGTSRSSFLVKGATTTTGVLYGITPISSSYVHIALLLRSGVFELHINAALELTDATSVGSLSHTTEVLQFGYSDRTVTSPEMAFTLWRVFDYAPTSAQIKSIYDKEKHLFKKYGTYTQEGESYSLDLKTTTKNRSTITKKNDATTLSGKTQRVVHRDDNEWNISTKLMHRILTTNHINLHQFREFTYSTRGSEQFTFDPYGTVASEDEPITAIRLDAQVSEAEEPFTDYFSASIKLREVE